MLQDIERNVGEDDFTHLSEILEKHNLSINPGGGSAEQFHKRSLDNLSNRCLPHHFDEKNSRELLLQTGFWLFFHLCILTTSALAEAVPAALRFSYNKNEARQTRRT
jgi:hypothetical protein